MKGRVVTGCLWLGLLGLLCGFSVSAAASGKYALVIGNSAYRGGDRLSTPVADARLIAGRLQQLGFTVALHTDRSRRDLLGDVTAFAEQAEGADTVVFYYAGHGFEVDGENFLMPVDLSLPLASLARTDLRREGVALRSVQISLARSGARARIILVDACRSAPLRGTPSRGFGAEQAANGTVLAWSTAPGSGAVDSLRQLGMPVDHSPFAWYLASNLEQPQLDVIDVLRQTQQQVSVATGGSQRPWYSSGLVGELRLGDTMVASADAAPAAVSPTVRQRGLTAPLTPTVPATPAAARRLWDREEQAIQRQWQQLDAPALAGLRKRAQAGDSQAAVVLGMAYEEGHGVRADAAQAMRYYRQAAKAGYVPGKTALGESLYENRLVPRDTSAAERLLQSAADAGHTRAKLDLAQLRAERGDGNSLQQSLDAARQMGASLQDLLQQRNEQIQQQLKDNPPAR
jgi:uncharacterized caspase-like protein